MTTRIMVNFEPADREALAKLAEQEMRPIREQIRYLLIKELNQRGLLLLKNKSKRGELNEKSS